MSAILLAVFTDYTDAERVRTQLVHDGFPTDRVVPTAIQDKGRAGLHPGKSAHAQFVQYFRTLLNQADETGVRVRGAQPGGCADFNRGRAPARGHRDPACRAAARVRRRARGRRPRPAAPSFEHAASRSDGYWVRHFMPENPTGADCIYCRLFPGHAH